MARASSTAVGVVLLVVVTVSLAGLLATAVDADLATGPPVARMDLDVTAATDRIALTHRAGDSLDVASLRIRVTVAGEPLAHQPPVPFFAARGFASAPTGPFNSATLGPWTAGETAALELAGTNSPLIDPGDSVRLTVRTDRGLVADLTTTAR